MSTIQISALPAASAITADDLLPIEHDPSGTPVTQKATAAIFAAGVRGIAGAYVTTNIVPSGATSLTVNATQADVDVRIKGDTDAALVFLDAGTNRVGIGTATPTTLLDVSGTLKATAFTGSGASLTGLTGTAQEFQSLASDPASPSNGDVWYNTTSNTFKGRRNGTNQTFGTSTYLSATGGTITTSGNYKIHKFTSSGTFTVTSAGVNPIVEYLVVAGGGAGGRSDISGGGGGAGGYKAAAGFAVTAIAYTITVGAGGAITGSVGGSDSSFHTLTSVGGGKGANQANNPGVGGSGGGGGYNNGTGAAGTSGQGFAGGNRVKELTYDAGTGGGGGGAGAVGGNGNIASWPTAIIGGVGGVGVSNSIDGNSYYYAGGGGGGVGTYTDATITTTTGGNGGLGGGGGGTSRNSNTLGTAASGTNGGSGSSTGSVPDAAVNTGSGGGGGCSTGGTTDPGTGGSGIIIIKYQYQ